MQQLWIYIVPFLASVLSAAVGYFISWVNRSHAETTKQKEGREAKDAAVQKQAELNRAAIERLREDFTERKLAADSARQMERLAYDKDFATITEILKEATETSRQLVGVLANIHHLQEGHQRSESDIRELRSKLDSILHQVTVLARSHAPRHE